MSTSLVQLTRFCRKSHLPRLLVCHARYFFPSVISKLLYLLLQQKHRLFVTFANSLSKCMSLAAYCLAHTANSEIHSQYKHFAMELNGNVQVQCEKNVGQYSRQMEIAIHFQRWPNLRTQP